MSNFYIPNSINENPSLDLGLIREELKRAPLTSCEKCAFIFSSAINICPRCGRIHKSQRKKVDKFFENS